MKHSFTNPIIVLFTLLALTFSAGGTTPAYATDITPPTVTITSTVSNLTSVSPIPVTITFSEPVIGFTVGDLTVGNGTAGNFATSGAGIAPLYTAVSAGYRHSCGLLSDNSLNCWGSNSYGQIILTALTGGQTYTAVSTGGVHTCGLVSDGSLNCWGSNASSQTSVPALTGGQTYTAVSAGLYHTCGLISDGSLDCWGYNNAGQTNVTALTGGQTYTAVSAGYHHSCGLVSDGSLNCWGSNASNQTSVTALTGGQTYTAVSAGGAHTCGLVSDGSLNCWGDNNDGQTSVTALTGGKTYTVVTSGAYYTCGLVSDGSLNCWGDNTYGQINVPALASGKTYTAVSAEGAHTCGLVSDGSPDCWGYNAYGQINMPATPVYYSAYTANVTPTADGVVTVDVATAVAKDMERNDNTAATQFSITYGYTVTFNANTGTGSMSNQTSSVAANLSTNSFTKTGYTFNGWNTAANGSGTNYANGASYPFTATITLYAKWTAVPVSITLAPVGTQDGWVLESSETSNWGGTLNSTATLFNVGDDAAKKQYLSILSFKTSGIPDNATITAVILKVKTAGIVGGGNPVSIFHGFIADIKTGFFGIFAALQAADFQATGSGTYGPFIIAPVSNIYSINLTPGKLKINKLATNSGLTQIRLRFKLDDNNNAIANYLSLYSGNAANVADRPQLAITYTAP